MLLRDCKQFYVVERFIGEVENQKSINETQELVNKAEAEGNLVVATLFKQIIDIMNSRDPHWLGYQAFTDYTMAKKYKQDLSNRLGGECRVVKAKGESLTHYEVLPW